MTKAVKIKIHGSSFLLPISHSDNYEFPIFITDNSDKIKQCVDAGNEWIKHPMQNIGDIPDTAEFKEITGIIGFPFDLQDIELYSLENNIDIVMEVDI